MELALRRRLEGVASISISQAQQTTEVYFVAETDVFSPNEFRAAVKEADVEVISFEIVVCGRIEQSDNTSWFLARRNRFALIDRRINPVSATMCVTASLDDRENPPALSRVKTR